MTPSLPPPQTTSLRRPADTEADLAEQIAQAESRLVAREEHLHQRIDYISARVHDRTAPLDGVGGSVGHGIADSVLAGAAASGGASVRQRPPASSREPLVELTAVGQHRGVCLADPARALVRQI